MIHAECFSLISRHRGAALAISLIVLVVITVLILAGSQKMRSEVGVFEQVRSRDVAFQAAEAALRCAERKIFGSDAADLSESCQGRRCRFYARGRLSPDLSKSDWWREHAWNFTTDERWEPAQEEWRTQDGRYVIMEYADEMDTLTQSPTGQPIGRLFYRVIAAGSSDGRTPHVILESIVARRWP